VNSYAMIVQCA